QYPAIVIDPIEQFKKLWIGIVSHIKFPDVYGISKPFAQGVKVFLQSRSEQILRIGVPANLDVWLGHLVKDRFHVWNILCEVPVYFHADQLSIVLRKLPHLIE